jgi:hypothetical protein
VGKFTYIANSFKSGQLGEKLVGRTDIGDYKNGCLELKNMIISSVGGAFRRPGTEYVVETKFLIKDGDLISLDPPEFAVGDELIVPEFGVGIIPYNAGSGRVLVISICNLSLDRVSPPSIIQVEAFEPDGTLVGRERLPGTGYAYSSALLGFDARNVRYCQAGRYLIVCSSKGDLAPFYIFLSDENTIIVRPLITRLQFSSSTGKYDNLSGFPILPPYIALGGPTLKLKYVRGATEAEDYVVATDSSGTDVDYFGEDNFPLSEPLNRIRAIFGSTEYLLDGTQKLRNLGITRVIINLARIGGARPADGAITEDWGMAEWGDNFGWPETVAFYQQRVIFAANKSSPNTVWFSELGKIANFMQIKLLQDEAATTAPGPSGLNYWGDLDDTQAFSLSLASLAPSKIQWLSSQRTLLAGAEGVEYALLSEGGALTPLAPPSFSPQTYHGSVNIQPVGVGRFTFYVGQDGRSLRDFSYSDRNGSYVSRELSVLSPDILIAQLLGALPDDVQYIRLAWQESANTLWAVTSQGSLLTFTFEESLEVKGWSYHPISGATKVWDICVTNFRGEGTIFLLVERLVDGDRRFFVEKISKISQNTSLVGSKQHYLDGGNYKTYGVATNTHTSHLEGAEVFALADGEVVGPFTVTAGEFTTPTPVSEISYGFKYEHILTTMPLEAGSGLGSAQGQLKRVDHIFMDIYKGLGGSYSYGDTEYPIEYPTLPSFTLYTGRNKINYDSTANEKYFITIKGDDPLPFGLLNMTFRGVTQD